MTTTSSMTGNMPGNAPDRIASGLEEDRLKKAPTLREQVDIAASTLLARIPQLPEHGADDVEPEQIATSNRLRTLQTLLNTHFEVVE